MITMARPHSEIWNSEHEIESTSKSELRLKPKNFKRIVRIAKSIDCIQQVGNPDGSKANHKSNSESKTEKLTAETVGAAWLKFWNTRSPSLRTRLIEYYLPIAKKVADRYKATKLPYRPLVEGCDLAGDAAVGLIQAVDKFNPYLEIKFETFCKMRMYGAIVDNLREMQPFSRSVSKIKRDIRNLTAAFVEKYGHDPTDTEFVAEYGLEFQEILDNPLLRSNVYNQGLNQQSNDGGSLSGSYSEDFESKYLAVEGTVDACNQQMHEEEVFELCCRYLPSERHRNAIMMYYQSDMTLKKIGKALVAFDKNAKPLCPSTVSKILSISHVILRQVPGLKDMLRSMDYK